MNDISLRAIYIGDLRFLECPVFEYNEEKEVFEMIVDRESAYPKDFVAADDDFLVFLVEQDSVKMIDKDKAFNLISLK